MKPEIVTISRKDLGDEAYIEKMEDMLTEMSEQAENTYGALSLAMEALMQIQETYEQAKEENLSIGELARTMYYIADLALCMMTGEPECDEDIH